MRDARQTVVGSFETRAMARQAVDELMRRGFTSDQVGVVSRDGADSTTGTPVTDDSAWEAGAGIGATAGTVTGVGLGLAVAAGLIPGIGPVIAGGTLAALAASAGVGAAAGGALGALVGLGLPEEDAKHYEGEFNSGRTIVSVHTDGRAAEADEVIRQYNGTSRGTAAGTATTTGTY